MDLETKVSDEMLMASVAAGKDDRLEPLLHRYSGPLLTFIQRMLGNHHRSEEIFQEVFFTVWDKRRQYQFPRPFRAWLFAIAVNKCREACRGSRDRPPLSLDEAHALARTSAASPEDRAISTETAVLVLKAVQELPQQQRAVVVLRVWENLSYGEIASIIGRTETTVRSHMYHGLATLRNYLEPRLTGG